MREGVLALVRAVVHVVLNHVGQVRQVDGAGILVGVASAARGRDGRGVGALVAKGASALKRMKKVEVVAHLMGERSVAFTLSGSDAAELIVANYYAVLGAWNPVVGKGRIP